MFLLGVWGCDAWAPQSKETGVRGEKGRRGGSDDGMPQPPKREAEKNGKKIENVFVVYTF